MKRNTMMRNLILRLPFWVLCSHNDFRFLVETPKWSLELIWRWLNEYKLTSHADSHGEPPFSTCSNIFGYFEQIKFLIYTN